MMASRNEMLVAMTSVLLLSSFVASSTKPTAMLLFGDSLSDVGNTYNATYKFIPSEQAGYWGGRFVNEPGNWVDYLTQALDLASASYMAQGGTNFAFGGGTACKFNSLRGIMPTLAQQYTMYRQSQSNVAWAHALENDYSGRFIMVWGGHNDLLEALEGGLVRTPEEAVSFAMNTTACIMDVVKQMVADGEQRVVVATLADMGATPRVREANMSVVVSALANAVNAGIKEQVALLQEANSNTTQLAVFDIGAQTAVVLGNWTLQQELGFTSDKPCVVMSPGTSPFTGAMPTSICTNPEDHTFLDDIHPSSKLHAVVAAYAQEALTGLNYTAPIAPAKAATASGGRLARASARRLSAGAKA